VRAAQADYDTSLNGVLYVVAQTFYAATITDEVVVARQSSVEVARATAHIAEMRFSVGAVTKADVDRAQLALLRAEQAEREARFAREQTYRALATLIQSEAEFSVQPGTPHATAVPDAPSLANALRLRPEFQALELTAASLATQSHAAAWRWSPTLSAFGSVRVFNYDNFAQQHHTWAVGLALDWVLYDSGIRDAQRRNADAQSREIRLRGEVLSNAIRDDLANQRALLDTKRHAHDAAERQVALAEETLGLVRTQYQAGTVAEIDLLRAQDDLTAAKEALAQAHLEVALADLALQRAAGTFPGNAGM
jgi:outer membrane protein TolC